MNKIAIKDFAIKTRTKLISEIAYKAGLIGISVTGIAKPNTTSTTDLLLFDVGTGTPQKVSGDEIKQRNRLVEKIREKEATSDYKTAFDFIVEEVAYTWFNRLIAIRFMEVNEYLPSKIRVLSSEMAGKAEPDMVTTPFDTDMDFTITEKDNIIILKDENKLDELFRLLFIKQCNKLNEVLPALFEKTSDYTELLLPISFTDSDGVVSHLVNDIAEEDFKEAVEIIGWMYQYYISEPKDVLINARSKYKKDNIPFVTQIFTSDWIVRYMVDNSLGKYWIERNQQSKLAEKLEYFIMPKNGTINYIDEKVTPEELTFFDPCMGSGHILVYAIDVLMEIYRECGYVDRDAAVSIIENNLYGLDIDNRAYQFAYFAVMMKARSYDRRFLTRNLSPKIYIPNGDTDCENTGSILKITELGDKPKEPDELTLFNMDFEKDIRNWEFKELLTLKYTIICTNPPYMNGSYMPTELKKYVESEYKDYKSDIFSAFTVQCLDMCQQDGYVGMLTPFVWMFISSYEKLRNKILSTSSISSLVQLEYNAFEAACVPVCAFVLKHTAKAENGEYIKLSDFKGIEVQAPKTLEAISNPNCGYRYTTTQENFSKIPGSPIAYWVSEKMLDAFDEKKLKEISRARSGAKTGKNDLFLKSWWEIIFNDISTNTISYQQCIESSKKWFPHNKGGEFKNWYGNRDLVVYFRNGGSYIKDYGDKNSCSYDINAKDVYFKKGITWTALTSSKNSFRFSPIGSVFDSNKGPMIFPLEDIILNYLLGFFISPVAQYILKILNPTLSLQNGDMDKLPIILSDYYKLTIDQLVSQNISISKTDWDSFETSWDFVRHPFLYSYGMNPMTKEVLVIDNRKNLGDLEYQFYMWNQLCENNFNKLKANEEELNRIFIDIYDLADELTPEVADKDVTIRKADLTRDIKSFVSYAIGCMFGRYSLDVDGLAYTGGEFDNSKYTTFIPDKNNCIPIVDEEYFHDDIVGRLVEFVKVVYGADTLEDNLAFIANALCTKGTHPREMIRNYFIKDFFKDHVKTYKKRPIYWLYDSGKGNGFKALIYMHRYNADTTGLVRMDYLHKLQKAYSSEIERMQNNMSDGVDVLKSEKRKEKLIKQLKETKDYDVKIAHLALSRINIDLDDGVKVNYEKVQIGQDSKKLDILGKI